MSNDNTNTNTNTNHNSFTLILDKTAAESLLKEEGNRRASTSARDLKLGDITDQLPLETDSYFEFEQDQVIQWHEHLNKRCFLILSSTDREVLNSAGQTVVAELTREDKYTPLVLRSSTIARDDFVLDVEPLLKEKGMSEVILVEAIEDSAEFLLKSITRSPQAISRVTDRLKNIDRRLVILTRDSLLIGIDNHIRCELKNGYLPYKYVSFLRPRLKRSFPQDYLVLEEEILRQRKAGLWALDEEPFYKEVLEALGDLRDEIRRHHEAGIITVSTIPAAPEPAPSFQEPLVTVCLFVAAFFPRLPVQDFNRLVPSLLDPMPRNDFPPSYKFSHGQGWMEERLEPKSDRELWRESYEAVLQKCQLGVQSVPGRPSEGVCDTRVFVVDFKPPFAASKAREAFLGLHYPLFLGLVRRLREVKPSYLFDPVSDIAKNTASLILASAESSPDELQVDWLLQLLHEAHGALRQAMPQYELKEDDEGLQPENTQDAVAVEAKAEAAGAASAESGVDQTAVVPKIEVIGADEDEKKEPVGDEAKRQILYENSFGEELAPAQDLKASDVAKGPSPPNVRFQNLLHEMMHRPFLKDTAVRLLHELFSQRHIGDVMALTWSLRDVDRFDSFKWWERLLNEGNKPTRDWVYSKILRMARNGESTEVVPAILAWLPRPKAPPVSLSSIAALYFYVDLNAAYLFDPHRSRQGWPPSHPVLSTLVSMNEADSEGLVHWLLHPGLAPILAQRVERHLQEWILFWLVPEPLLGPFFEDRHQDFRSALSRKWMEAWEAFLAFDRDQDDTLLFPALVLADWAVELMGENPPPPEARGLLDRVIAALFRICDLDRRRALEVLWTAVEESLLDLLVFLEQLDPRPAALDRATASGIRRTLQNRRRCVKQLRCDLQARSRLARAN